MIRKARIADVKDIYKLIETFANKGEMLHRPLTDIYDSLRDFYVYEEMDVIIGACALHICWEDMGEIRSLAVSGEAGGKGIGTFLVNACLDEARALGIPKVFALTYKPGFFEKVGFKPIGKEVLPHKVWGECVRCFKFPNCDENAVMIEL
ncbi:MAG: N-acetyltransferase [Deltaproteobacteria bacterium]|nr:N-acetyltransferase [Deltaproteobacteria bacterium]